MFQRTAVASTVAVEPSSNDPNSLPPYGSATSGQVSQAPLNSAEPVRQFAPELRKIVLAACCGSFLFGFSVALLNTSLGHIVWELNWCDYNETPEASIRGCRCAKNNEAFINTALFVGATLGAVLCTTLLRSGRRRTILLSLCGFTIGAVNTAVSSTVESFFWARLITGFALGLVSVAVPTYIAEMTPPEVRGFYGTHHQMLIVIGIFAAALLGLPIQLSNPIPDAVGKTDVPGPSKFAKAWWRLIVLSSLIPVCLSAVWMLRSFPFETPHWLLLHNQPDEARRVLNKTEGPEFADDAFEIISHEAQQDRAAKQQGMGLAAAFRDRTLRWVIFLGCVLAIGQQVSGINVFMARSSDLFSTAGLTGPGPVVATTFIFLVNVLATIPAVVLIERLGRRNLLLWGTAGQTICLAPAMLGMWAAPDGKFARWAAGVGTLGFVVCFALAYGPVLWVYLFEMFPSEIKQTASSLAVGCNWTAAIVMVFLSQYMNATANFSTFTVLSLLSWVIVYVYIKETKGRTLGDSPYVRT